MTVAILETEREKREFAGRMRRFRKANLLSRKEAAELMEVHPNTIKNIELALHGLSTAVMTRFRHAQRTVSDNKKAGRTMRVPR